MDTLGVVAQLGKGKSMVFSGENDLQMVATLIQIAIVDQQLKQQLLGKTFFVSPLSQLSLA